MRGSIFLRIESGIRPEPRRGPWGEAPWEGGGGNVPASRIQDAAGSTIVAALVAAMVVALMALPVLHVSSRAHAAVHRAEELDVAHAMALDVLERSKGMGWTRLLSMKGVRESDGTVRVLLDPAQVFTIAPVEGGAGRFLRSLAIEVELEPRPDLDVGLLRARVRWTQVRGGVRDVVLLRVVPLRAPGIGGRS